MHNCKPLFGNKVKTNHKINLIEKNVLVASDEEITKTFKEYFDEIVPKLIIKHDECHIRKTGDIEGTVKKHHLSISTILVYQIPKTL